MALTPDLASFTFTGEETIELELSETVSSISLNAIEIEVSSAELTLDGGAATPASSITLDEEMETVTFSFGGDIPAGSASLTISFTGTLNDQLAASIAAATSRRRARSKSWPPRSSRPPTPAAHSPAGTILR